MAQQSMLVVENNRRQREGMVAVLKSKYPGFEILSAAHGDGAESHIAAHRENLALVVTDFNYGLEGESNHEKGIHDGVELIKYLRGLAVTTPIPIILVSGDLREAESDHPELRQMLDEDEYLVAITKPAEVKEISEAYADMAARRTAAISATGEQAPGLSDVGNQQRKPASGQQP